MQKVFDGEYNIPLTFRGGPRIIDLGANYGSFSIWASHRWPGCRIEAYEPHPETFLHLRTNTSNYIGIKLHNHAIGTPGRRWLSDGNENEGEASLHVKSEKGHFVEVISPLDLPEAEIIKIDTEGSELEIIEPLIKAGRTFLSLLIEYHSEEARRSIDLLLKDYLLIGSTVEDIRGRGVVRYIRKDTL